MEILIAAQDGNVERVEELLASDPALVNARGDYDKTPPHWAAEKNDLRLANVLLAAGADINAETTWGSTPLQWAANMGRREVADLLLAHGAAPQLNMWAPPGWGCWTWSNHFGRHPTLSSPTPARRAPAGFPTAAGAEQLRLKATPIWFPKLSTSPPATGTLTWRNSCWREAPT